MGRAAVVFTDTDDAGLAGMSFTVQAHPPIEWDDDGTVDVRTLTMAQQSAVACVNWIQDRAEKAGGEITHTGDLVALPEFDGHRPGVDPERPDPPATVTVAGQDLAVLVATVATIFVAQRTPGAAPIVLRDDLEPIVKRLDGALVDGPPPTG